MAAMDEVSTGRALRVEFGEGDEKRAWITIDWPCDAVCPGGAERVLLLRYDLQGSLWLGYRFGVPLVADVYRQTLTIGGDEFRADLEALKRFLR